MDELLKKGEVRIASGLELLWIRLRILSTLAVVVAGCVYGLWALALKDPIDVSRLGAWLGALGVTLAVSAVGMNLAYHPYFSHGAFKTSRFMKICLGIIGAANLRGPVIDWAAHHRRHHKYTDIPGKDPHTPWEFGTSWRGFIRGQWWVFLGEKLTAVRTVNDKFAKDLVRDRDVVMINRSYEWLVVLQLIAPGLIAYALTRSLDQALLASALLGCARAGIAYTMIAVPINGWTHQWGGRPFGSQDRSTNLKILSLPTFGGSLHHNHHAFPKSLKVSLDGELDPFDALYWFLEKTGLIWDVNRPTPAALKNKRRPASPQPQAVSYAKEQSHVSP